MAVTIKDVAKRAGVSYSTVSRALNGIGSENTEKRKRILEIAEEMGLTKPGEAEHIRKVLDIYGLPHKCDLMLHDLIGAIALDKKNLGGKLNVVLLKEIGKSYTYPTTTKFFTEHDRMV